MAERKNLTITEVKEIERFGADKQGQKLPFKAKDGDAEYLFFTFKRSLFDLIKEGQIINADVEISTREWGGNTYTDRKITQIYVEGQPINVKGSYRGASPEELELRGRLTVLSYSKDLVVADKVPLEGMLKEADRMLTWLKVTDKVVAPSVMTETTPSQEKKSAIDMDWLKESLEELNWADVGKWLKGKYPEAKGTTVKAIVESLSREHQEAFVKEVQTRLEIQRNSP